MFEQYYNDFSRAGLSDNLTPNDLQMLFDGHNPVAKTFVKGDYIINEGECLNAFGLVVSGEVMYITHHGNGTRSILETFDRGEIFGMASALCGRTHWKAGIIAKTNCKIVFVPIEIFGTLRAGCNSPETNLLLNMLQHTARHCLGLIDTIRFLRTRTIREKIATYLISSMEDDFQSEINISYDRDQLADYLYIPRPSLSRELSNMRRDGLIDFKKSVIHILDIEALRGEIE